MSGKMWGEEEVEFITDGVLLIEGKKLYVNKGSFYFLEVFRNGGKSIEWCVLQSFLAAHSHAYFKNIFFGDFTEKTKAEVEIKEVAYDDMIKLLQVGAILSMKTRCDMARFNLSFPVPLPRRRRLLEG